jgi:hypothetical protein
MSAPDTLCRSNDSGPQAFRQMCKVDVFCSLLVMGKAVKPFSGKSWPDGSRHSGRGPSARYSNGLHRTGTMQDSRSSRSADAHHSIATDVKQRRSGSFILHYFLLWLGELALDESHDLRLIEVTGLR